MPAGSGRPSPGEETDAWFRAKLDEWRAAGRLRPDGTLRVNIDYRGPNAHLTPEAIAAMLSGRPKRLMRVQKVEVRRMHGKHSRTWRRAFDRSGPVG